MKMLRQITRRLRVAVLMASAIVPTACSVFAQTSGIILKARVQVAGDNVTLRDVVASGSDAKLPEDIVLCQAPDLGTVRTLDKSEIARILHQRGVDIPLQGPDQIGILRLGRRISPDDLRPIIEAALKSSGPTAVLKDVAIQSAMMIAPDSTLELSKLKFDAATLSYRAWFAVMKKDPAKPARRIALFEATATLANGSAPVAIDLLQAAKPVTAQTHAQAQAPRSPTLLLVHRGESAMMRLEGEGFQAMLVVICLEDGGKEKIVRARDITSKRIYKAQVTERGRLRELSVEN